jgi:hypothetical protein
MQLSLTRSASGVSLFALISRLVLAALVVLGLSYANLNAQVLTGTMSGTVVDASGAVVPGTSITVTDTETGRQLKGTSDAQGEYTFTGLSNGFYKLVAEHAGFAKFEIDRIQVFVSQATPVPIKLEVARAGQEVVVQAEQTVVQTESVELKNSVDNATLENMPLPTRDPLDLVKTFAGITTPNTTSVTGGDAFVHGLRGNTTNLTQDGINVQDNTVKTSAFFAISSPVVDTIEEFNVTVGGGGVDAGFGSAQVSMVTKRGTNDIHGSAYWFERTSFLNANTWFNNAARQPTPFQLQNRIGGTVGGPWYIPKVYNGKNKTFFFFSYQAYREPRSSPTTRTVLDPSAEQGLFTYTPTGGSPTTVNLLNIGTIGTTGIKPVVNSASFGVYQKIVPQSGFTNTGCGGGDGVNLQCLTFNEAGVNNQGYWTTRIDHQITSKNSFSFVWNRANFNTSPDFLNANQPPFLDSPWNGGQISTRETFTWALTSVITSAMTNEVRIGYQHAPVAFAYGNTFSETGGYQVAYAGVTSPVMTGATFPQGRNTPVRQYIDNYAWVKGNHQMRFGGEFRQVLATDFNAAEVFPLVTLGTNASNPDGLTSQNLPGISPSELALANDVFEDVTGLLATVAQHFNHTSPTSGYVAGAQESYTPIQQNLAFYAQDNWKIKRNLSVFYGVRWEYQGPYDARNGLVLLPQNNISTLLGPTPVGNSPVGSLFQPGLLGGDMNPQLTLQGGSNGQPVSNRQLHNFGPFAGIAYSPGKDGKTVIRASFAQHYDLEGLTFYSLATTENDGLFTAGSNGTPTGVFSNSGVGSQLPAVPAGSFPVSQINNWLSTGGAAPEIAFDKNMATPYVLEWSLGVQRDIGKHFVLDTRYVGNHAVKQYRIWSLNQLDLNNNGVLQTFLNAQNNLTISGGGNILKGTSFADTGLPGQVPTPLLDELFAGLPASSGYSNSTFLTNLTQNNIYSMFNTIRTSKTYLANVMGTNGLGAANGLPLNFFVADPWATQAYFANNAGWSEFDGLEVEIRRRWSHFTMQGNYTFSKVLADTTFAESQSEAQNYQNLSNTRLDKFISAINVTHSFGVNFSYQLPFGRGQYLLGGSSRLVDSIVGGWSLNGFTHLSSGAPLTLSSNRFTTGFGTANPIVVANVSQATLRANTGVYEEPSGVYFINPKLGLFNINGASSTANLCQTSAGGAAGAVTQTTPCFAEPAPGQINANCGAGVTCSSLSYNDLNFPWFFDQDLSVIKDIRIFERLKLQLRLEAFDVFNNVNFDMASIGTASSPNSTDSTTFGQLTGTFDTARGGGVTSRIVQWGVRLVF